MSTKEILEYIEFFEKLGYTVSHDYYGGEKWREIYKNNKLILQVNWNVPLDILLEDLKQIKSGKDTWESRYPEDYVINAEDTPEWNEFLEKMSLTPD